MPLSIESIASTRKKTKEVVRVGSLIPEELQTKAANLIVLLQDYYDYLNQKGQPSFEVNSINDARDIDSVGNEYLDLIQKEIAVSIPKNVTADRVKLYKNLMKFYSLKGSQDSIDLFFKILFDDLVEVYYPKKDMLIPSSGAWDQAGQRPVYNDSGVLIGYTPGVYLDNRGFLSDTIKIQDSYFYQQFSYVIRTGNNVSTWKNSFNRLVHPAGFIFFGEILIILEALLGFSAMPNQQPGLISDEDIPVLIILFGGPQTAILAETDYTIRLDVPNGTDYNEEIHYYDDSGVGTYGNFTFDQMAVEYAWADLTINYIINNSVTWKGVNLGATLLP